MIYNKHYYKFHRLYLNDIKLKFINWFYHLFPGKYCWADAVSWAHSPDRRNPFKVDTSRPCEAESKEGVHLSCYCGNWNDGTCWDKLSKAERKRIREEQNREIYESNDELPF